MFIGKRATSLSELSSHANERNLRDLGVHFFASSLRFTNTTLHLLNLLIRTTMNDKQLDFYDILLLSQDLQFEQRTERVRG